MTDAREVPLDQTGDDRGPCSATEALCICDESAGHDGPHICQRDGCGGSWTFDEAGNFVALTLPGGYSPSFEDTMLAMADAILGPKVFET